MQRAEGRPESCLHRATTQGEQKIQATSTLIERENQGYTGFIQDFSRIPILSFVVLFLDTLISECGVFIGFGIPMRSVVAHRNVGYLYTRVCVIALKASVCVCVCVLLLEKVCVCVLNIVGKFLTL